METEKFSTSIKFKPVMGVAGVCPHDREEDQVDPDMGEVLHLSPHPEKHGLIVTLITSSVIDVANTNITQPDV